MTEFVSVVLSEHDERAVAQGAQPARIATLLLSRPPTNALTRQVCRELAKAAAEVGRLDDVCAVIVFGGHEIFSAGADMPLSLIHI